MYKMIGPVLVKQTKAEVATTVTERLKFVNSEMFVHPFAHIIHSPLLDEGSISRFSNSNRKYLFMRPTRTGSANLSFYFVKISAACDAEYKALVKTREEQRERVIKLQQSVQASNVKK